MNAPNVIVRPALTPATKVVFFDEGETCGYKINGEVVLRLHYSEMFRFAQMLRMHAKRAKKRAGDTGRHWGILGELADAEKVERGIL